MRAFFTKDRLRTIFSVLLAFLVCLGLFFAAVSAGLLFFSKESSIIASVRTSGYTAVAINEMTEELNDLAIPSGLPDDFFDGKVDKAEFEKLFYSCAQNTLARNTEYTLSVEAFEKEVSALVTDYSKNEVGDFSSEVEKDIESFSTQCGNIYLSYVNPSLISYVLTLLGSAQKYVVLANVVSIIFTVFVGFVLYKLNSIRQFVKYSFSAFAGASLTVGVIPLYLILTKEVYKIAITSKSLYAITTALIADFLWVLIVAASVLALISLILICFQIKGLIFKK